jgi:transposase
MSILGDQGETERQRLAEQIGRDGFTLMAAVYAAAAPAYLGPLPSIEVLRRTWVAQYWVDEGCVRWRQAGDLPPEGLRTDSPYDPEAHYATKRSTAWTGYKVHLTETCDADQPHLITHVDTTLAATSDVDRPAAIQEALGKKALLPKERLVDAGYVDADLLGTSMATHGVELVGPVRPDVSWQAQHGQGYDVSAFRVAWDAQQVTCPQGKISRCWTPHQDRWGNAVISVKFSHTDCRRCENRSACTRAKTAPRCLTLHPQADHQALHQARQCQATEAWRMRYQQRAGIEGTLAQGIRAFGLRRCRYSGLAGWYDNQPLANTRTSRFAALPLAC